MQQYSPMLSPTITAELLEAKLIKLLATFPPDFPAHDITVRTEISGVRAALTISRFGSQLQASDDGLHLEGRTIAELTILAVVKEEIVLRGRRVVGKEIRAALKARGIRRSASTINHALANLVAESFLVNDNDKQGYGLPE